jgi:AraC family transcriptional regulator of adaptative response/methylated-DNA-[protein]-cysteine methyltransferase
MTLGATGDGICLVAFGQNPVPQIARLRRQLCCVATQGSHPHLDLLKCELADYFAGRTTSFRVPLVYPGSSFQRRVWAGLREIPYGETCSYEGLACKIGQPNAVRAVGNANGQNFICILIPCHRVVRKDGAVGGYGGGGFRKEWLLDLEKTTRKGK